MPKVLGAADLSYLVYSLSALTICLCGTVASNGPIVCPPDDR
jgi:hypothetical protein